MISKRSIKILTLILIFILLTNFIYDTYFSTVNAEAITMTSGLAIFLKALYAMGITALGGHAVKELTEESIELYREWQEFMNRQQPDKKLPDDWEKRAWKGIVGVLAFNEFKKVIDSVKEFISEKGGREGNNNYIPGGIDYTDNYIVEKTIQLTTQPERIYNSIKIYYRRNLIEIPYYTIRYGGTNQISFGNFPGGKYYEEYVFINGHPVDLYYNFNTNYGDATSVKLRIEISDKINFSIIEPHKGQSFYTSNISNLLTNDYEDIKIINYYIDENTYYLTNDENDIRYVYPDIESIIKDKIVEVTRPDGTKYKIYTGTLDDLYNEWSQNINSRNIFTDKPSKLTETEEGVIIGDNKDELPYPDINPEPIEDTPQYQGKVVGLLQSIINWLKNIADIITEIPKKLFEIPEDIELDTSKLRLNDFQKKFPFSIPWDIKRAIEVLAQPPSQPDLEINIDTEYLKVNHTLDISLIDKPLRFARYVASIFFILYLANKTRDLIKW